METSQLIGGPPANFKVLSHPLPEIRKGKRDQFKDKIRYVLTLPSQPSGTEGVAWRLSLT
jgi:hypothetical protein